MWDKPAEAAKSKKNQYLEWKQLLKKYPHFKLLLT